MKCEIQAISLLWRRKIYLVSVKGALSNFKIESRKYNEESLRENIKLKHAKCSTVDNLHKNLHILNHSQHNQF